MVSCQVHNGSETVVQRVYQSCRWPGPCANVVRVAYRSVTALEWRCCPGFLGDDCSEDTGGPMTLRLLVVTVARCQLQDPHQAHLQSGIPLGDGAGVEVLPWLPGGRLQRGPTYRVAYRSVTALEWRCCPGFLGDDCSEELGP
ncbi:UNVERIFIED_CONTAM: hypothetical protein FKN15_072441 [Acipenser sinensis]